ncbi:MAG: recombinase family protein [Magnetovibrio sp.]|nr:recombinase family protein [Magnetovibrio sp.]
MTDYVVYYRVSTAKQGRSGLGLDAQRTMVTNFLNDDDNVIQEFTEIQSGSKDNRVKLLQCLRLVKKTKSKLLIPKLDRFSRKVSFISGIIDQGVDIVVCEHPNVNTFFLHLLACFAEEERRQISERTKLALREAKKRGVELGKHGKVLSQINKQNKIRFIQSIRNELISVQSECSSLLGMSQRLNDRKVPTYKNKQWYPQTVKNYLGHLGG